MGPASVTGWEKVLSKWRKVCATPYCLKTSVKLYYFPRPQFSHQFFFFFLIYRSLWPAQVHHARNSLLTLSSALLTLCLYWVIPICKQRYGILPSKAFSLFPLTLQIAPHFFFHRSKTPWKNHLCSLPEIPPLHFSNSLQSGFDPCHPIKANISHDLLVSKSSGPFSGLIFLDPSAAFNTLDQTFLLKALSSLGF